MAKGRKKAGETTFTTPSEQEVVMTRVFNAPSRLVFAAWTSREHLPYWMLGPSGWTMPICEVDLRPGGSWRFVWRNVENGSEVEMHGLYREITPPERLVSTASWGDSSPELLNTLTLSEENGKTTVRQTVLYPSQEIRDQALASGMKEGTSDGFNRLDEYLQTLA